MAREVDAGRRARGRIDEKVPERGAATRLLEPIDAAEAVVVEDHDDERQAHRHRGRDLGVHHQIAAVADHDEHVAVGQRHLRAETTGDLVSHAGISVLEVIALRIGRAPELVKLAGQPAGGAHDDAARSGRAVDGADHLSVGRRRHGARPRRGIDGPVPLGHALTRDADPFRRRSPGAEGALEFDESSPDVRDERPCAVLGRIERSHVEPDQRQLRMLEQRARSRDEVRQPRADGEHDVRVGGQRVRGGRAGHAEGAHGTGMIPRKRALAGLRLGHRQVVMFHEATEVAGRERVRDASAGDDERTTSAPQAFDRRRELGGVRTRSPQSMNARDEKPLRKLGDFGLDVLRQGERHRAAPRGIGEDVDRRGQARHELLGTHDPVPVTRDRAKAIVGGDRGITEILHLLEHGVRLAAREDIAGQQQQGKPVDMRDRRRRHHVRRAGADRARARQEPLTSMGFRKGDGGMGHPLLVVRPERRQLGPRGVQRLTEAGDVAVAEDREHASHEREINAVDLRSLRGEIPDERLGHRESVGVRRETSVAGFRDTIARRGIGPCPARR